MTIERNHPDAVARIIQREFNSSPERITRMTNGICNDVYLVSFDEREVIVRLKSEARYMLGSHNHIPIFRTKGIRVPEILAEDYTSSFVPFAYQVQSKIDGRDIKDVITTLGDDELKAISGEIGNIFRQLCSVPNNGKFGVLWGDGNDLVDSWSAEVARVTNVVMGWGRNTGVLDRELEEILNWINVEFKPYFDRVRPYTYYGDICAKNVMIHGGRFAGLVDLDALAQGDPLEAVGRIKASWYGTHHGTVYSDAVMDAIGLTEEQRKIVTMYAVLNRTFWTVENGVKFNQNTSGRVDPVRLKEDKAAVRAMYAELRAPAANPPKEEAAVPPPIMQDAPLSPAEMAVGVLQTQTQPIHAPKLATGARPAEGKIMLEASGLSKTYVSDGIGFDALKNVDLRIHKGDCVAIVGKSGSGKSTLMHLLACLDKPTEGYVYVDGDETSTMSEPEKNLLRNEKFGFVFQQFFLNGRDTVVENVLLPLRIRGANDFDIITASDAALAAVGLGDKSDKKAKDLSGGEKQRVCIARALVGDPQVIFADEPTGNLDSNTGAAVENMLFDLNREKGITLVIVTHDPDLARRCPRIIEMKDGKIVNEYKGEASEQ